MAIFIDSVDEYFNKHIKTLGAEGSDTGQLAPGIWYYSQMGLVEVAYELRRISQHLKVFASVRKEAFGEFRRRRSWCSSTAAAPSTSSTRRRACGRSS